MIMKDVFKTYFDKYDTQGVFHTGFIQSIDLSSYVDFTFLNDLSTAIVDSFLYNEFSNRVVLDRWKKYMKWDKDNKRFVIDPTFYTNAVNALYVYLAKSEKFFAILNTNFSTLSATEIETINHGARTGSKSYGAQTIGRDYDKVVVELMRGTETENRGTHTDTETRGAHTDTETHGTYTDTENKGSHTDTENHATYKDTENLGARSDSESLGQRIDSETVGAQTNETTKTEKIHPYDAQDFVNDTQSIENVSNGAQSNGKTTGAQANSSTTGAQTNETTYGAQQVTNIVGAQSNSNVYGAREITNIKGGQENSTVHGAQENTKTFGKTSNETKARADAETRGAHTDNESISAYIDTKNRTKVLILSPEKYYMILKELADKNIYTLFADAVNGCFLSDVFTFQALENGGVIL